MHAAKRMGGNTYVFPPILFAACIKFRQQALSQQLPNVPPLLRLGLIYTSAVLTFRIMLSRPISIRRYGQMVKRVGRLMTGRDVLYKYDVRPKVITLGQIGCDWTIAPEYIKSPGVMYSFGIETDITFDEEVSRVFGLDVHGFDPSIQVADRIAKVQLPPKFTFHPYGIGQIDGEVRFFHREGTPGVSLVKFPTGAVYGEEQLQVRTLATIVNSLHTSVIEILKLDVEGEEYKLIPALIACPVPIKQLLIEFHHRCGIESLKATVNCVEQLRQAGYLLYHVAATSSEFSFVHSRHI